MSTKDYSSKQEKLVADFLGGRTVVASGSRPFHPGDVEYKDFLLECKTHENSDNDIVFYQDVWNKISEEANSRFRKPIYVVDDGSQKISNTWCMFLLSSVDHYISDIYPYKFKKNIKFSNKDFLDRYFQDRDYYCEYNDTTFVYRVPAGGFDNVDVGICTLSSLADMI